MAWGLLQIRWGLNGVGTGLRRDQGVGSCWDEGLGRWTPRRAARRLGMDTGVEGVEGEMDVVECVWGEAEGSCLGVEWERVRVMMLGFGHDELGSGPRLGTPRRGHPCLGVEVLVTKLTKGVGVSQGHA
ncbi:hypothetical protein PIB30_089110 [Stylosanthes scabra]|uniref:Uncharacterized protein n=1 Tax=Stylosanthes scabra TaxID=79078 RepID=A0ABU6WS91_9FABA|nr:hypothetical protein [Stylosanthes scabra]